jgi:hypothetical protein
VAVQTANFTEIKTGVDIITNAFYFRRWLLCGVSGFSWAQTRLVFYG